MGLAKESLQAEPPDREELGKSLVDLGSETDPDLLRLVGRLRDSVKDLPQPNLAILRYIISHLRRWVPPQQPTGNVSPSSHCSSCGSQEALLFLRRSTEMTVEPRRSQ